jgi:S1-C subfamily serine protease
MKFHSILLLTVAGMISTRADTPPVTPNGPAGIIVLKAVAGYSANAASFVGIQWVDNNGGYVTDAAGNKTPFLNEAIGRIVYFDQWYYDAVDHNQYWIDWRASVRSRELVFPPLDPVGLRPEDLPRLRDEEATLEDVVERYPSGQTLLAPIIASLHDDSSNLSNGLVLQNGKWIAAKDAAAPAGVPVVGEAKNTVSFTTKDGKNYANVTVTEVADNGVSVLTEDGGATIALERLPDDLSTFPEATRAKITDLRSKAEREAAAAAAASAPPASTPPAETGFFGEVEDFVHGIITRTWSYFGSGAASAPSSEVPPGPAPPTAAAPPVEDLSTGVVLIKGDVAEGTGFLARTANGPVVITNLHVVSGNPNLKIITAGGEQIVPLSMQGASDRDLAMFAIQDNKYSYLELATNVDQTAHVGDATIIPGNSEGGEVTLKTKGSVVGIGPQRVEFDNPIYHGNSGGPVMDTNCGKVVAVATGAIRMSPTDDLDKNSFASSNSAIKGPMRYFGLRVDTVPSWQNYDQDQFVQEGVFLKSFHLESRALDSYMNGATYERTGVASAEGYPDSKFYLTNEKIRTADQSWRHAAEGDDKQTALQELIWTLGTLANGDVGAVQNPLTFYHYDQEMAIHELAYRKALITQIGNLQSSVNRPTPNSTPNMGL